ncbi:MAG: hypothetical protein V4795_14750 [Pseudomonadota bacterium]
MPSLSLARLPAALRRCLAITTLPLLLVACGGGGGSAGNTNSYNLDGAISRAMQTGVQVSGLTGSLGGVGFTLALSYVPLADAPFEGTQRHAVRETVTISGGGSTETTVATNYFSTGPYVDRGSLDTSGALLVRTSTGNLPTAARVGDSGPLNTGISYADASKQVIEATTSTTWSLDADTDSTALACQRTVINEVGSATPITGVQCWRINTAGDVLGSEVSISVNGSILQFR